MIDAGIPQGIEKHHKNIDKSAIAAMTSRQHSGLPRVEKSHGPVWPDPASDVSGAVPDRKQPARLADALFIAECGQRIECGSAPTDDLSLLPGQQHDQTQDIP
jgi:hypothetical protein